MGATPVSDRIVGTGAGRGRREDLPDAAARSEGSAWGYLVHPSLMPTVFAPSQGPAAPGPKEAVARKA